MTTELQTECRQGTNALVVYSGKLLTLGTSASNRKFFPGGTFEPTLDTDLFDCCVREALEEAGVVLEKNALRTIYSVQTETISPKPGHTTRFIDHYYYAPITAAQKSSMIVPPGITASWSSLSVGSIGVMSALDKMAIRKLNALD